MAKLSSPDKSGSLNIVKSDGEYQPITITFYDIKMNIKPSSYI
jgi:hypothetical protein